MGTFFIDKNVTEFKLACESVIEMMETASGNQIIEMCVVRNLTIPQLILLRFFFSKFTITTKTYHLKVENINRNFFEHSFFFTGTEKRLKIT